MRSRELPGTTFAVRFPENNFTPQNVCQPIRFKHSTARSINHYIYRLIYVYVCVCMLVCVLVYATLRGPNVPTMIVNVTIFMFKQNKKK